MRLQDKVLVLNSDYQAVTVCTVERAFILSYTKKAEVISEIEGKSLKSKNKDFVYPSIIRLRKYVHLPYRTINLTRHNIFKRDDYKCVYCGSNRQLTVDHVIPKSAGGSHTWTNTVTACKGCNSRKSDKVLKDTPFKLKSKPFRPSFVMFLSNVAGSHREDWKPYLYNY